MKIVFGRGIKSRYWKCDFFNQHRNKKNARESFDHGLTPEMLEFLGTERKVRARWLKKVKAEGKKPGAAIRNRKLWKVANPPVETFR
jgi:hypothetical protein